MGLLSFEVYKIILLIAMVNTECQLGASRNMLETKNLLGMSMREFLDWNH